MLKDKIVDITEEKNYVQQKPAFNKDINYKNQPNL